MALQTYQIKIVDNSNQEMLNFPMATRYADSIAAPKNNKLTSQEGGVLTLNRMGDQWKFLC